MREESRVIGVEKFIPDKEQHSYADEVKYAQPRIFRENAIPNPHGEWKWQFSSEDEPQPSYCPDLRLDTLSLQSLPKLRVYSTDERVVNVIAPGDNGRWQGCRILRLLYPLVSACVGEGAG